MIKRNIFFPKKETKEATLHALPKLLAINYRFYIIVKIVVVAVLLFSWENYGYFEATTGSKIDTRAERHRERGSLEIHKLKKWLSSEVKPQNADGR